MTRTTDTGISSMATFFGEIIPSFSRAVDDEEDDIETEETASTSVRWSPLIRAELLKVPKLTCQILIVAVGPAAAGFAQAHIIHEDYYIIGAIFSGMKDTDVNTFEQMLPSDKTCYIYRSRRIPDVFVCLCKTDVDPEQSYSWVNQLFVLVRSIPLAIWKVGLQRNEGLVREHPSVQPIPLICAFLELFSCLDTSSANFYMSILCSYMTSEYKSEIPTLDMDPPFMRSLKTTKFAGTPLCPFLEQPNLVSGLPAQLITHCQMQELKAILYICYTDSIFLDHDSMKLFRPLLQSTPIKDLINENPKAEEVLNHIVELYSIKNSMYL